MPHFFFLSSAPSQTPFPLPPPFFHSNIPFPLLCSLKHHRSHDDTIQYNTRTLARLIYFTYAEEEDGYLSCSFKKKH